MSNTEPTEAPQAPSRKAKALSARLYAVQALYQKQQNNQPMRTVIKEYLEHRKSMIVEGEELVQPDEKLFRTILLGVEERAAELGSILDANLKKDSPNKEIEPLLKAILYCGAYELLMQDVDSPIIINDYLNVGHAFYERSEVGLINGVLDSISKLFSD